MGNFKTVLALDTALNGCSVGLAVDGGAQTFTRTHETMRGQAEHLVPEIEALLGEAGTGFEGLSAILTTYGPGAFAGLRIGLSTVRAFGLALNIPVIGVSTFYALAMTYKAQQGNIDRNFCVLIETKRTDFYAQIFDPALQVLCEPMAAPYEDVLEAMKGCGAHTIVGNALERFQIAADQSFENREVLLADMGVCAQSLAQKGLGDVFVQNPEPLYLRGADVSKSKRPQRKIEAAV